MGKVQYADFVKFLGDVSAIHEDETIKVFSHWRHGSDIPECADDWPFWCYEKHDKHGGMFHLHFMDLAMKPMAGQFERYCGQNGLEWARAEKDAHLVPGLAYDVMLGGRTIATVHDAFGAGSRADAICVDTTTERPAIGMVLSIPFLPDPMVRGEDLALYRKLYKI